MAAGAQRLTVDVDIDRIDAHSATFGLGFILLVGDTPGPIVTIYEGAEAARQMREAGLL